MLTKMRTFSFKKKDRYNVNNDVKRNDPVADELQELSLSDRGYQKQPTLRGLEERCQENGVKMKERHQDVNENGWYNNIPRVWMPGSCGQTCGPTYPARPPLAGTMDRGMTGPTSGVFEWGVPAQTQTIPRAGNAGPLKQPNIGLTQAGWQMSSCSACVVVSQTCEISTASSRTTTHCQESKDPMDQNCESYNYCPELEPIPVASVEGDYQSIRDLTMTQSVNHDDVKTLRHDATTLRHRLASTSSSSGVSSASEVLSERSVASTIYASFKAILDKRKHKQSPEIKVSPQTRQSRSGNEHYYHEPENVQENVIKMSTKRTKSKSVFRPKTTKVKSPKSPGKVPKNVSKKSPARPRKRKRVVALARGLGCVGGARSRSVTPERHQLHRIHQLSRAQQQDLDLVLKNVQQRVRNVLVEGRDALNDANTTSFDHVQSNVTNSVTNNFTNNVTNVQNGPPSVPPRVMTAKAKSATLGSGVTGRRLSRWERHQECSRSPPDLSDVTCKRSVSMGNTRFSQQQQNSDIQNRPLPPIPDPPRESSVSLIKTLDLSNVMKNSWISGLAVNSRREEIILVDLEQAYVIDMDGNLKKIISNKNGKSNTRLKEPIDVCVQNDGTMIFSDHADRQVKLFNTRGQHLRSIHNHCHMNIAGVTCNESGQIFVAGTDSGCVSVYGNNQCPPKHIPEGAHLEHPYSVAVNPLTGSVIVGDDYKQLVVALGENGKVLWRYCPTGERHFFPSSICVDTNGYIFIADLYNEKIYMLDSGGKLLKTLLSKGRGLHGGPGAIAADGKGHLYVADQEKSLKIFKYGQDGFAMYRRFSIVRK